MLFSISQLKDLATSSLGKSERYADDPAYTEDVRHLAMPMRRNSGPESSRRKSCSILDGPIFDRNGGGRDLISSAKKKYGDNFKYDEKSKTRSSSRSGKQIRRDGDSSSSDECNYNRRGQSLDRSIIKQQKRTLCFTRDRDGGNSNRRDDKRGQRKETSMDNLLSRNNRYSVDFSSQSRMYPGEGKNASNYNASGQYNSASYNEQLERSKSKESSKFQIGKRFLRGEIGIKSFNYYLLKEGLKSTKKSGLKQQQSTSIQKISRSEENIYEELHFNVKKSAQKQMSYPECELCIQECTKKDCEICKASAEKGMIRTLPTKSKRANRELFNLAARSMISTSSENIQALSQGMPNVLQYQSYNPKNPGVYKIETTPVAFTSDYNPIEDIYNKSKYATPHKPAQNKKSSSSSDSLHHNKYQQPAAIKPNDHYERPNDMLCIKQNLLKPQIYKTDSRASIISEMSIKSESSNRYYRPAEMSDSSMGDSMFSYSQQRRYFGSAESCRFGYECRRCSYDGEKCSFSDNCRYECRNCDCSSSYFSSDFDDGNFSRKSSARISNPSQMSYYDDTIDTKTTRYAEDFIKHVNNVKKSSIYQTIPMSHANTVHNNEQTQQRTKIIGSGGGGGPPNQQDMPYIKNNPVYGLNTSDYETLSKEIYKQSTAPRSPRRDKLVTSDGISKKQQQPLPPIPTTAAAATAADIGGGGTLRKDDLDVKYYHKEAKKASLSSKSSNSSKSDSSANRATGTIPKLGKNTNSKADDLKHLSPYKAHPPNGRSDKQRENSDSGSLARKNTSHPGIIDTKIYIKKPEIVDAPKIGLPTRDRSRASLSTDDDNDDVFEDERRSQKTMVSTTQSALICFYSLTHTLKLDDTD